MNKAPTIKGSAQARLLLYQLLSSKLTEAEQKLLVADPSIWEQMLARLEAAIELGAEKKSDRQCSTRFFLISSAPPGKDCKNRWSASTANRCGSLTRHHQTSAGIKKYRWQTSHDERVRDSHKKRDGNIYAWDGQGPHPRGEVNCRCGAGS